MSDKFRFSKGLANTISAPTTTETEIEVGDLVFLDGVDNLMGGASSTASYKAYPFSSLDSNSITTELANASDYFLGIALEASDHLDEENILVGTDGDWNVDIYTSSTCKMGYSCESYGASTPNTQDQQVAVAASTTNPLGWWLTTGTSKTSCIMRMRSRYGVAGLIA